MAEGPNDIELKFNGETVRKLRGAPADAVIASLHALQRIIYIIGMRSEGRSLSKRLKPTAKVKREYAIVCKAASEGSHVQPFSIASQSGAFTPAAASARIKLLKYLKAFDSGEDDRIESVLPDPRERWFIANAALGLLPPIDSGISISIRDGSHGPFSFKADRARATLERYDQDSSPEAEDEVIAGKLRAIDYGRTVFTIKPIREPALRIEYPFPIESWLQANVRKRLRLSGELEFNQKGDVASFKSLRVVTELEPTLEPIKEFEVENSFIEAHPPLSIPVTVDWVDRMFVFQDDVLGINALSLAYNDLRQSVLEELDVLWRQYALAPDAELDEGAAAVKQAMLSRFRKAK